MYSPLYGKQQGCMLPFPLLYNDNSMAATSSSARPASLRQRTLDGWDALAKRRPLPIQFALYASQRVSRALCPAFVVRTDGVEIIRYVAYMQADKGRCC